MMIVLFLCSHALVNVIATEHSLRLTDHRSSVAKVPVCSLRSQFRVAVLRHRVSVAIVTVGLLRSHFRSRSTI